MKLLSVTALQTRSPLGVLPSPRSMLRCSWIAVPAHLSACMAAAAPDQGVGSDLYHPHLVIS